MITARDVTVRGIADARDVDRMAVREAMSADILLCFEDDPVEEAEQIMRERHVQRLAVLNRADRHQVGIIALTALPRCGNRQPARSTARHLDRPTFSILFRLKRRTKEQRDKYGSDARLDKEGLASVTLSTELYGSARRCSARLTRDACADVVPVAPS